MVRTVVSLEAHDKEWLDREAARQGVPMTELIRRAVRLLRKQMELGEVSTDALLKNTQGIWRHGDPLVWQQRLREEWE